MTCSRFVRAGKNRVHNFQARRRTDASFCETFTTAQVTIFSRRTFKCAHHRRTNGDDTPATLPRLLHCFRRRHRNTIRLVKRQQSIQMREAPNPKKDRAP